MLNPDPVIRALEGSGFRVFFRDFPGDLTFKHPSGAEFDLDAREIAVTEVWKLEAIVRRRAEAALERNKKAEGVT